MKLLIDIPNYNLNEVQNGSIASNEILKAVRNGTPYESKGDLISREVLKKAFDDYIKANPNISGIFEVGKFIIDNAPTVHHPNCDICEDKGKQYLLGFQDGYLTGKERPQGKWIPVSERLPERNKEVIVTDIETEDTYCSWYHGNGYWECDNGVLKNRIIAWQPLPEPYKKDGEENGLL